MAKDYRVADSVGGVTPTRPNFAVLRASKWL
jgi:hypothetical protein